MMWTKKSGGSRECQAERGGRLSQRLVRPSPVPRDHSFKPDSTGCCRIRSDAMRTLHFRGDRITNSIAASSIRYSASFFEIRLTVRSCFRICLSICSVVPYFSAIKDAFPMCRTKLQLRQAITKVVSVAMRLSSAYSQTSWQTMCLS